MYFETHLSPSCVAGGFTIIIVSSIVISIDRAEIEDLAPIVIVPLNNTLNLACRYADGFLTATVGWLFNNVSVDTANPRSSIRDAEGILNLTVTDINHNDSGEYTCRATNNAGSDATTTMLLISSKFRFQGKFSQYFFKNSSCPVANS